MGDKKRVGVMDSKFVVLGILSSLFLVFLISSVFADFSLHSVTSPIDRAKISLVNFTINNSGPWNLTQIQITLPFGTTFYGRTNYTTTAGANFTNRTSNGQIVLLWSNTTAGLVPNDTLNFDFWFNISINMAGNSAFTVVSNDSKLAGNSTTERIEVSFAFSGYVRNETGGLENSTNVTIYQFVMNPGSPPTEIPVVSVLTNMSGLFNFTSINGSAQMYTLKMVYRNASSIATKVGTTLPAFPAMMYYPLIAGADMSLDNSTFYLQPAMTLRLNATNSSVSIKFGYQVIDQKIGFPIESNILSAVSTKDIIVPSGRAYTVMFLREFSQFTMQPNLCDGNFFNNSHCPSPPKSNITLATLVQGQVYQIVQDLRITNMRLQGCVGIGSGHNQTNILNGYNITNIFVKLQPWPGFIPPTRGDTGNLNLTADISYNLTRYPACNSTYYSGNGFAYYNISLLGSTPFMVEIYAKNASTENQRADFHLVGFVNLTTNATGLQNQNITLYRTFGSYWTNGLGVVNTSTTRVNILNETGGAVTTNMHVEIKVRNTAAGIGTVSYIIESLTNGSFYIPILNNTEYAKVAVFANDAPPVQKLLNLSNPENNITLVSIEFSPDGDKGMRRMNESGQLVQVNTTDIPMQIRFLRRGTDEVITSMGANGFNPLKALVAGSVDLEMKITTTNVTMRFNNFDMLSAKQPPMFAVMDNKTATATSETFQFGNFVPREVYDNVTLTIPYDQSVVNENLFYNMSIPILYEEKQDVTHQLEPAWNISAGNTNANLSTEFLAYNNSRYRDYLSSGGVRCSTTDVGAVCFMNTTNDKFVMEIPHFSGISSSLSSFTTSSSSSSTSTGGGSGQSVWGKTYTINDEQFREGYAQDLPVNGRIKFKYDNKDHHVGVTALTSTTATVEIASTVQTATLSVGDEKKFDLDANGYYDVETALTLIKNNMARISAKYISEKIPAAPVTGGAVSEGEEGVVGVQTSPETTGEVAGKATGGNVWVWIGAIIVIVLIAVIVIILKVVRKRK